MNYPVVCVIVLCILPLTVTYADTMGGVLAHDHHTEHDIPRAFQLPPGSVPWQRTAVKEFSTYESFRLQFPSPVVTPQVENNVVHCEYFRPRGRGPYPAVVVLHILGGDFELSRICCRALASQQVAALFVKMPHYGPRRSPGSREEMISADPEKTVARLIQAVKDIRRGADWLASQNEVDPQQMGITGISLGGIVASLTAGIEPRFQKGCFLLAGGDLAQLVAESTELIHVREAWKGRNVSRAQVAEMLQPIDPLTYAHQLQGRKVLMINARRDTVVPRACTEALWQAAGKPELIWWNADHYSAALFLPAGLAKMVDFFQGDGEFSAEVSDRSPAK